MNYGRRCIIYCACFGSGRNNPTDPCSDHSEKDSGQNLSGTGFTLKGCEVHRVDKSGNVLGCLPGRGQKKPLVVSAHLDTVFPFDTDLQVRREEDKIFGPGIGDNSLGLAGLFGLLWVMRDRQSQRIGW